MNNLAIIARVVFTIKMCLGYEGYEQRIVVLLLQQNYIIDVLITL